MKSRFRNACIAVSVACLLAACGGGGGEAPPVTMPTAPTVPTTPPVTPPTVAITITAPVKELLAGGAAVTLTATTSDNSAVTWSLAAGTPGTLGGNTGATVTYTPPASGITTPLIVKITASSGTASQFVELFVYPDPGAPGLSLVSGAVGRSGLADGTGQQASFTNIRDLAADTQGNYYVADGDATRHAIRKIAADGSVTTLSRYSDAVLTDPAVYSVAGTANGTVHVLDQSGTARRLSRIGADGKPVAVLQGDVLNKAERLLAAPGNTVYVISWHSVRKLDGAGTLTLVAGNEADDDFTTVPVDGLGAAAHFKFITAAAVDSAGNLLVLDNDALRRVSAGGAVTTPALQFPGVTGIPALHGMAGGPDGAFQLAARGDVAPANLLVYRLAADGQITTTAAFEQRGQSRIAVGSDGKLLLAWQGEVRQVVGQATRDFAGQQAIAFFDADGTLAQARFSQPGLLAPDRFGNLYVADKPDAEPTTLLQRVPLVGLALRKIGADGQVTTLVRDAAFQRISGIVADRAGNLYVSEIPPDQLHATPTGGALYKVTPAGQVTLLAGIRGGNPDAVDGPGMQARFTRPFVLGTDEAGNIYLADGSGLYRKVAADGTTSTIPSLPAGMGLAPDGARYAIAGDTVVRIAADGTSTIVAGAPGQSATILGALPGALLRPAAVVPAGPRVLLVISGEAIVKLVLPH